MDRYDGSRNNFQAMKALSASKMDSVALNYKTLDSYSNSLLQKRVGINHSQMVRPIAPKAMMRAFSTEDDADKKKFEEFVEGAEEA